MTIVLSFCLRHLYTLTRGIYQISAIAYGIVNVQGKETTSFTGYVRVATSSGFIRLISVSALMLIVIFGSDGDVPILYLLFVLLLLYGIPLWNTLNDYDRLRGLIQQLGDEPMQNSWEVWHRQ
jgi:hypothetical protein